MHHMGRKLLAPWGWKDREGPQLARACLCSSTLLRWQPRRRERGRGGGEEEEGECPASPFCSPPSQLSPAPLTSQTQRGAWGPSGEPGE